MNVRAGDERGLTVSSVLVILFSVFQSKSLPGMMRLPTTVMSSDRPRETTFPVSSGRF